MKLATGVAKTEGSKMLYAEWSGKSVTIRNGSKVIVRTLHVRANVVGVQCSGNDVNDGRIAIAMDNGKTDLYQANGTVLRRG